jgi:hypothetical protein
VNFPGLPSYGPDPAADPKRRGPWNHAAAEPRHHGIYRPCAVLSDPADGAAVVHWLVERATRRQLRDAGRSVRPRAPHDRRVHHRTQAVRSRDDNVPGDAFRRGFPSGDVATSSIATGGVPATTDVASASRPRVSRRSAAAARSARVPRGRGASWSARGAPRPGALLWGHGCCAFTPREAGRQLVAHLLKSSLSDWHSPGCLSRKREKR